MLNKTSVWISGPPGWIAVWSVTYTVLLVVVLAGFGVAEFKELFEEAGFEIVSLIPATLVPYLGYRSFKGMKEGRGEWGNPDRNRRGDDRETGEDEEYSL